MRSVVNILGATNIKVANFAADIAKLASKVVFYKKCVVAGLSIARN